VANKPIVLLQAMKACGALLVNTQSASEFILWKLEQARDELLHEFVGLFTLCIACLGDQKR
jgi:hypothetical protein